MLLLTFVHTGELRGAKWDEINFDKAEWRIPTERMKMKELHIVPLSRQAVALFKKQQQISHNREYIFPNSHKPLGFMSENTMLYGIYRMGYHSRATGHGFRATASTILNEHGFKSDVCDNPLFPAPSTIFLWLRLYPEFSEQYARAKDGMTEEIFWDMLEIADNGENDTYVDEEGNIRVNHDVIARSKLRVDTRKWILARLAPKKYGDRSQLDLTSSDGSVLWAKMSNEEKGGKT